MRRRRRTRGRRVRSGAHDKTLTVASGWPTISSISKLSVFVWNSTLLPVEAFCLRWLKGDGDIRLKQAACAQLQVFSCSVCLPSQLISSIFIFIFITQARNPHAVHQATGICSRAPHRHSRSVHTSAAKKSTTPVCANTGRTWESTLSASQRLLGGGWEDGQRQVPGWSCFTFSDETDSYVQLTAYIVQLLRRKKDNKKFASHCTVGMFLAHVKPLNVKTIWEQNKEGSCSFHSQQ